MDEKWDSSLARFMTCSIPSKKICLVFHSLWKRRGILVDGYIVDHALNLFSIVSKVRISPFSELAWHINCYQFADCLLKDKSRETKKSIFDNLNYFNFLFLNQKKKFPTTCVSVFFLFLQQSREKKVFISMEQEMKITFSFYEKGKN